MAKTAKKETDPSKEVERLEEKVSKLKETVADKAMEEIARQANLIVDLKNALGELISHCPECGSYTTLVGWNSDVLMRKCSDLSCKRSFTPLPGLARKRVVEIEMLAGVGKISD